MRTYLLVLVALAAALPALPTMGGEDSGALPKVREERPRLFVRAKAWDGPSVEKIKTWMDRPEYKHLRQLDTLPDPWRPGGRQQGRGNTEGPQGAEQARRVPVL